MKQNLLIVGIYIAANIALFVIGAIYAILNPDIFDDLVLQNNFAITLTSLFYFGVFLILVVAFRKYLKTQIVDFFKRIKKMLIVTFLGVVTIYGTVIIISFIFILLNVTDEAENQAGLLEMMEGASLIQMIFVLSFITLLAPVVEELVFRKGIYGLVGKFFNNRFFNRKSLSARSAHNLASMFAIFFSSLAFGLMHATDIYLLLYGGLGAVLGLVYFFSNKNIFAPIVVHLIYNTISILLTLLVF